MPSSTIEEVIGNILARPHTLQAGEEIDWHRHPFDHATYCMAGRLRVYMRRGDVTLQRVLTPDTRGSRKCLIPAGWEHQMIGEADGTEIECIYSHRDPQGRVHQRYTGWDGAYV